MTQANKVEILCAYQLELEKKNFFANSNYQSAANKCITLQELKKNLSILNVIFFNILIDHINKKNKVYQTIGFIAFNTKQLYITHKSSTS